MLLALPVASNSVFKLVAEGGKSIGKASSKLKAGLISSSEPNRVYKDLDTDIGRYLNPISSAVLFVKARVKLIGLSGRRRERDGNGDDRDVSTAKER